MQFRFPKDNKEYHWTSHIKNKMVFYRISEQKIKTILKSYDRKEEGIVPNTMAVMKVSKDGRQAASYKRGEPRSFRRNEREEIWLMYQNLKSNIKGQKSKVILISTWRYPGKSKPGKQIPIPDDILQEIQDVWFGKN